ncbi:MAG: Crp/Fnr family transcriptional regulator [Deltaproteobacteria bacterium]|nr:Crp/Fnr family transcriptional regulator [Candidatus Anaeroferrophillus wilburensis]MBN2887857.1 Crp/Fnr family transcriptional regulator [Deltaproteobacteria bacterium]
MAVKKHIASSPIFAGLPDHYLDELAGICTVRSCAKGQLLFAEGDEGNGFYLVESGRVKIYKASLDGKEQILHIFGAGEPFGEVPVFAGQSFPANAIALERSSVLFFPRQAFIGLIERHPQLALNMLAVLSRRLRQFTQMIDDLSLKEVPGRLAAYLLFLSKRHNNAQQLELEITKSQLAGLLGTIPETLSRILAKMSSLGLLQIDGPRIIIADRPALEELAAHGKLFT